MHTYFRRRRDDPVKGASKFTGKNRDIPGGARDSFGESSIFPLAPLPDQTGKHCCLGTIAARAHTHTHTHTHTHKSARARDFQRICVSSRLRTKSIRDDPMNFE